MSDAELAVKATKKALSDFEYFCKHCIRIRAKDGTVRPLVLNSVQRKVLSRVRRAEASGRPLRFVILKARQMGVSTFIEIYLLWRLLREGNLSALIMAHEKQQSAPHIYGIMRFAAKNLPQWFRAVAGISAEYDTKTGIVFGNGSSASVTSADSDEPGRSLTIQLIHLSEAAFYEDAEGITAPLFAALPKTANTAVFVESTGNGPAGFFFNYYQRAKRGKNEYLPLFFPWYEHEEYRLPVPEGVKPYCPPELEELYAAGKIDDEQLWWRQWVIENDFGGDESRFQIEYPATEEQAWLSNTANWFDTGAIYQRLKELKEVPFDEGFLYEDGAAAKFQQAAGERLHVFKYPEPGRFYVVGADVGSGVATGGDGDASCADVLDVITGEQVAHLHMVAKPTLFAQELKSLGMWYNNAMIAPEVTGGHGLTVALWLAENGYPLIYHRRVYDSTNKVFVSKIGWDTSRSTKMVIVNLMRAAFTNGEVVINEEGTLREMLTFIRPVSKKTGTVRHDKAEAMPGAHDDRVLSIMIANALRKDVMPYAQHAGGSEGAFEEGPAGEEERPLTVRERIRAEYFERISDKGELGSYA